MAKRDGTHLFYIPTALLAEAIEPLIGALDSALRSDHAGNRWDGAGGALNITADRAAKQLGDVKRGALQKRLWAIRNTESSKTHTEIADAILLALDTMIEDTALPTLPGTLKGALEMQNVWGDGTEPAGFARTMLHFCAGFTKGLHVDLDELVPASDQAELVAA